MTNLENKIQNILNLYKSKNLFKAESLTKELLDRYPKNVFLYNLLGLIFTEQNKVDDAVKCYKNGIEIDPNYSMIYNNLGSIYQYQEKYSEAENYYKKSIKLDNKIPEPHNNLGNLYLFLNKYSDAIKSYSKATEVNPNFAVSYYNLGIVYKTIGDFEKAKKSFNLAIKLNPYFCIAHRNLSELIKYTKDNDHFALMKKLEKDTKINDIQKTELSFALGKAYEDIKDFDNSFNYYNKGNNLRRKNITFSINIEQKEFDNIKNVFSKKLFRKHNKSGNLTNAPIFILGMPRSGTTLVEQILSSHPTVYGGGELNFLPDLIDKNLNYKNVNYFFENLPKVDKNVFEKMSDEYIDNLNKLSKNSKKVTDKLPINFKWIGIIKLI